MERHYEDMETAIAYQQYRFSYQGLRIAERMTNYLYTKLDRGLDTLAVDIGCGTGFMTRILAPHFTRVIGLDCSTAQLKVAKDNTKRANITYKEGFGENLDFLFPESVDLITVAVTMHWLKKDIFFSEVDRVLKPGGCIAVVIYDQEEGQLAPCRLATKSGINTEVDERCQALLNSMVANEILPKVGEASKQWLIKKKTPSPEYNESHCFSVVSEKNGNTDIWTGFLKTFGRRLRGKIEGGEEFKIAYYKRRLLEILSEVSTSPETVDLQMTVILRCNLYRKPIDAN